MAYPDSGIERKYISVASLVSYSDSHNSMILKKIAWCNLKLKAGKRSTVFSVAIRNLPCTEQPAPPPMTIPFKIDTFNYRGI